MRFWGVWRNAFTVFCVSRLCVFFSELVVVFFGAGFGWHSAFVWGVARIAPTFSKDVLDAVCDASVVLV